MCRGNRLRLRGAAASGGEGRAVRALGGSGLVREADAGRPFFFPPLWLSLLALGFPAPEAWSGWLLKSAGYWASALGLGLAGEVFGAGACAADTPPRYLARRLHSTL